jgi:hypothetical protein
MKNLNKIKRQLLEVNLLFVKNKNSYSILDNKIGFYAEYYFPEDKDFRVNFYNYNHVPGYKNEKLSQKYPRSYLKSEYKELLRKKSIYVRL